MGQRRWQQRGLTRLEFAIVVILFVILFGTYLRAVHYYQEQAEAISVRLTLSHIQVGFAQEWAGRISTGKNHQGVAELVGTNPVRWLEYPPPNYLGEMKTPKVERLEPGSWFFDLQRKELVYLPRLASHLEVPGNADTKALRWTVRLAQNQEAKNPEFGDLALVPVYPYQWF